MRQVIDPQLQFGEQDIGAIALDPKSRDDIPQLLRGLQHILPLDRELTISCGAALGNLGAAARYFGRTLDVDASSEGSNPDRLAPIRLAATGMFVQSSGLERTLGQCFDSSSKSPDPHIDEAPRLREWGVLA
jgi:hypothetical protein